MDADVNVFDLAAVHERATWEQPAQESEGMDAVFTVAGFDAAQTDELPFPDILALHKAIVNETFGVAEEEKN